MSITLTKVKESQKHILRNLYSLYLHDLSAFTAKLEIGEDGSFHYESLERFWEIDGISPYFIKLETDIIGFLLLLERPFLKKENDFGVNDLFILNQFKGKGWGREAVNLLFEQRKGKYFVIELEENRPAVSFWKKLYAEAGIEYQERQKVMDEEPCLIQTFTV
ncbi:GNAT family N-acetyltransferase [Jeotgalibacillus proteolyticus]|uniref:GNAT family N-acetyltransferase n=1 Tax=Jeotgalibacillus proteolyticus TaxID=2082395 RepID=A0A2S5GDS2_9BACL|nr:GNAT family N-acetyltransferase [Jeotgalibacillus proteolyticus]PPA71065.1 GNAT family N-acetyltransferase [Jeotgalibacillus proteolyticus]